MEEKDKTDNGFLVKQVEEELHRFSGGTRFICAWLENQVADLICRLNFRTIKSASVLDRDTIAELIRKIKCCYMRFKYYTVST